MKTKKTSMDPSHTAGILSKLETANAAFAITYPGESSERQAVHTVYGGAHLFRGETAQRLGARAIAALDTYGGNEAAFAEIFGLGERSRSLPGKVYERVREKLQREPVEDFRLDFEDGYGYRPDDEEDATAIAAGKALAQGLEQGSLPPFVGIRIKSLSSEVGGRAVRTLDLVLTTLLKKSGGQLPPNFVVTLPKVVIPEQVTALVECFEQLEGALSLNPGSLRMEIMVETPQSLVGADGRATLPSLVRAARGRCVAAHFGVYDFTAGCSITASHQAMRHLACDVGRQSMLLALAGTGVRLSDGATNVLPVPIHTGDDLTRVHIEENRRAVHQAWRLHYEDTQHSMRTGFYQGWDLHPAQLVSRYAAVFGFFLSGFEAAAKRLRNFVAQASQATLVGDVFDDAATGQGLLNYFLRALNCGAITEEEALSTGLTLDELRSRSFVKILDGRRRNELPRRD